MLSIQYGMTIGCLQRAHIYIKPKHKVVIPGDNTCFVDYGNDLTRSMDDNMVQSVITDRAGKSGQHECRLTEQDNAYTRSLLGFQPQRSSEVNSERTCADRRAHL